MKTLIIIAHPNITDSVINKRWLQELKKHPTKYTTHELTPTYPDEKFDIHKEQKLIEAHDNLVLQFPIQWFSSPSILKKWLDDVLQHGWAYGKNGGDKLTNRKLALAVTTGIPQKDYQETGRYHYTLEQILTPFETTLRFYCHANYRPFFAFYGSETTPGEDYSSTSNEIEKSTQDYLLFLENM